ncbi:hypothetical protein MLD38_011859 [Melastoma candidum]|uniref:Uncharacterized protein n=1 Tax=Melastoma candidum TaxID=119954 RepID=A0ACB9R7F2_9MYRT|nr:hypothetical protein MLD38_011859 [Melastoma candidum]
MEDKPITVCDVYVSRGHALKEENFWVFLSLGGFLFFLSPEVEGEGENEQILWVCDDSWSSSGDHPVEVVSEDFMGYGIQELGNSTELGETLGGNHFVGFENGSSFSRSEAL